MALDLRDLHDGKLIYVIIEGKLVAADYAKFTPHVEEQIGRHGKISMIVRLRDFHGWGVKALWEDIKFDARHFNDFRRIAMVGDKQWEAAMATFCTPFTTADVRYFPRDQTEDAIAWASHDLGDSFRPEKVELRVE